MALENKLGITSSPELAEAEERISKKKAVELFENGLLGSLEAGTFASLKTIHKYLFDEIYDFAGELRTVNIAKGNFRFAPLMYLEAALANIDKLVKLIKTSKDKVEACEKLCSAFVLTEKQKATQMLVLT